MCSAVPLDLPEWVDCVFGRTAPFDSATHEISGPNRETLTRLTSVFEDSAALLEPYSDETLNQAFWDLSSDALHGLRDEKIEWSVRRRLIESFETLFRHLFAARCRPVLGHRSEEGSPLNLACYMWWDFDCWTAAPDPLSRNPLDSAFLASMEAILKIDHVACQESALHGLGHWHHAHNSAVETIIDKFLKSNSHLSAELSEYAHSARCGCVQ